MSSDIEDLLSAGEEVQDSTNPSVMDSIFVKSYVVSTVLIFLIIGMSLAPIDIGFNKLYFLGLLIFPLALLFKSELQRRFIQYYITSQKVIERRGILSQSTESTMYENITDVKMSKDINERIFDVGDIKVNTAGHDGATIILRGLKDPERYKRLIEENINNSGNGAQQNQGLGGNSQDFGGGMDDSGLDDSGLDDSGLDDSEFDDDFGL